MKRTLLMPCLVAVGLAVAVSLVAGVDASTLLIGFVALVCPLMMLLMMGGMLGMARRHGRPGDEPPGETSRRADTVARS